MKHWLKYLMLLTTTMLCGCTMVDDSTSVTEASVKSLLAGKTARKWKFGTLTQSCGTTMTTDTEIILQSNGKYIVDGASNQCDWSIRIEKSPVDHKVFLLLGNDVYTIIPDIARGSVYMLDASTNRFERAILNPNGTVRDLDGNTYATKIIGGKNWMVENLKTTKFNDGTSITSVATSQWSSVGTNPAMAWQNDDATTMKSNGVGAYYNYYAVQTNRLCPVAWHVPTDAEWSSLINYAGGDAYAGTALKSETIGGANSLGFNGLISGTLDETGTFFSGYGVWWINQSVTTTNAKSINIASPSNTEHLDIDKGNGTSIRCVED